MLLIAQYYPPDVGGASTRVSNLQRILLASGYRVIVIAAFPHYPSGNVPSAIRRKPFIFQREGKLTVIRTWIPAIPHNSFASRLILYLSFSFSAIFALPPLAGRRFAAVWALSPNYLCMIPGLVYGRIWRVPVIHDVVDVWPVAMMSSGYTLPKLLLPAVHLFVKVSYILPDVVVALTESIRRRVLLAAPTTKRVRVVPNAVEQAMFDIRNRNPASDTFSVMYLGTLAPSNDFAMMLDAARQLKDRDGIRFRILGSGEGREEIERLIREHRLDNVLMEGKPVRHEEVPERLSEADALLLLLKKGFGGVSFPSKLGEYLASGRPVICSAEGDLADLIRTEQVALLVSQGSGKELAEVILKLEENRSSRLGLGERAKKFAASNLSSQGMANRVRLLMQDLHQNNNRTPSGRPPT